MALRHSTLLALSLFALSAGARAEEPCSGDAETCGRRAFEAGIDAYQKENWANAAKHFEAAHVLRPHPVVLFNWALAEQKLGRHVRAIGQFDRVLADPQTPKELLPEVQKEKEAAEKGLAILEIDADPKAERFVDEKPVDGSTARVDPGEHRVRLVQDGKTLLDKTLTVKAGERVRLAVDRPKEVMVFAPPPKPPPKPAPPPPGPSPLWFYAGAGVTAVLGGVTAWSAFDTKRAFDDYERDLPSLNQREADARVADGHDKELRTNLLIGATALVAAGTAALGLFVVDWGPRREGASATLFIGPAGLSAAGRF